MAVDVVIVSYHTGDVLWQCIDSVVAQPSLGKCIVVNNGNIDDVLEKLKKLPITLISGHGNIGFATACNLGAAQSTAEITLFLNPDTILTENSLDHVIEGFQHHPNWQALGGLAYDENSKYDARSVRYMLTPFSALLHFLKLKPLNAPKPTKPQQVAAISGACMALRKTAYKQLNGFDGEYFLHVEDADICKRMALQSMEIGVLPHFTYMHIGGSSNVASKEIAQHKRMSFARYFKTHFPNSYVIPKLASVALKLCGK